VSAKPAEAAAMIEALPALLQATRQARGLSLREAAQRIGVGHITLLRTEQGELPNARNAAKMLRWIGGTR